MYNLYMRPSILMSSSLPAQALVPEHHQSFLFDHIPLLMLWILAANDVYVFPTLSPHALAAVAKFLDRAPDFHTADLLSSDDPRCLCGLDL